MTESERIQDIMQRMSEREPTFAVGPCTVNGAEHIAYVNAPRSLRHLFERAFAAHGDSTFVVYGQERYSFAEIRRRAVQLSHALVADYAVTRGDRVAIAMRNLPEWLIAFIAIEMCGATVAALNAWWTPRELQYGLADCGARLAIVDAKRLDRLQSVLVHERALRLIVARPEGALPAAAKSFAAVIADHPAADAPDIEVGPDDLATILYTSGSTGHPKGVLADHRAVVNQLWMLLHVTMASRMVFPLAAAHPPAALLALPLFHANGCFMSFLVSLLVGQKLVMMKRWESAEALRLIEAERIGSVSGVPTMLTDLLNAPERERYDLSSLQVCSGGGAMTPPRQIRELQAQFPAVTPSSGYALTETSGSGCLIAGEDLRARPASVGKPTWPLVTIRLTDEAGHVLHAHGSRGEIWIKSVTNMRGYWNQPQASAQTLQEGWIRTGDLGQLDADGFLYIGGRLKDIIIRGGENISCMEVEAALFEHPDVLEACVFGVRDERLGEEVGAAIVPRPGRKLDPAVLDEFLGTRLASFKIPRHIDIREQALPRIASGKIDRQALKDACRLTSKPLDRHDP